jgi:hypothetical protein
MVKRNNLVERFKAIFIHFMDGWFSSDTNGLQCVLYKAGIISKQMAGSTAMSTTSMPLGRICSHAA